MRRHQVKMEKITSANMLERKWLSLSCFILQNSLLIMGLKACTISSSHSMNQYITSTAVILSEILKFVLSTLACFLIDAKGNYAVFKELVYTVIMDEGADTMKLCVPALLYTVQNNLQYVIEEAPLFLVLYQSKILTTALFYSTLLSRRLSTKEWASIIALCMGVSMVESSQVEIVPNHASNITGVVAVVFACLSSGVAGVSFEKILKSSRSSIWMINMQMSLLSAFFCTSVALTQDAAEIAHHGIFTGYNPLVVLSILLQALTGLAVALVVKYADNIYKGFGHSISLVFCSTLSSIIFEDITLNETFLLGSFLVVASCAAYASMTANTVVAPAHMAALITIGNGLGSSGRIAIEPAGAYMMDSVTMEEGSGVALADERNERRTSTALWGGGGLFSRGRASSLNNNSGNSNNMNNGSNTNSMNNSTNNSRNNSTGNITALLAEQPHLPVVREADTETEVDVDVDGDVERDRGEEESLIADISEWSIGGSMIDVDFDAGVEENMQQQQQ